MGIGINNGSNGRYDDYSDTPTPMEYWTKECLINEIKKHFIALGKKQNLTNDDKMQGLQALHETLFNTK